MKISIPSHDLSINSLGRAYILAVALNRYYDVEIVGPASDGRIWEPLRNDASVRYKIIKTSNPIAAAKAIDGDVIFASKPKGTSFGYALIARRLKPRPLILDIDDWDIAFLKEMSYRAKINDVLHLWNLNNLPFTYVFEKLITKADAISVSNTFLQGKFGGDMIPHFRDTGQFDPKKFDQEKIKSKLGLKNKQIVLFLGTPRVHKGIDKLIKAMEKLEKQDMTLLIVGASDADMKDLPDKSFIKVLGRQPFSEIPKFLAAADLIVLFQSASKSSQGQLPAKLFDAMSMAKPVIASKVSDLPKILKHCGIVVAPEDTNELAKKIEYLLDHPTYAQDLGHKAREECIKYYSYDAIAPKLHALVEKVRVKDRQTAKT